MSRSIKDIPIFGNAICSSEKQDKRKANRCLRHKLKVAMACDAEILPLLREVSDTWLFGKDGKHWLGNWIRNHPESMRK